MVKVAVIVTTWLFTVMKYVLVSVTSTLVVLMLVTQLTTLHEKDVHVEHYYTVP